MVRLIKATQASRYAKNENPEAEEFIIVSPCTSRKYRLQLTKFDKYGAVYDIKRNDAEEIVKEIPNSYDLVEVMEK